MIAVASDLGKEVVGAVGHVVESGALLPVVYAGGVVGGAVSVLHLAGDAGDRL